MPPYKTTSPVTCDADFNRDQLVNKTAIITGADATVWEDQVRLFKEAEQFSPSGKIHYVIANAGITKQDQVFSFDGERPVSMSQLVRVVNVIVGKDQEPQKPDLKIIDVNLKGSLYTAKLAMHYFVSQNGTEVRDDQEEYMSPEYSSTKWAVRGMMHALRRTAFYHGSRVNVISPWYIRTSILSKEAFDKVKKSGVEFATAEDAGECALRILSDPSINGKSLFICARKWAPRGYLDLDIEDYTESPLIQEIQYDQMRNAPVDLGLFP
ncbi:hypothetical protein NW762_012702 [Fusarium torreyae]|uniref:Uncharacterized protein n=1 Tax=Fusarium torreyae TaxID=1237075 RepID=A0A9W8RNI1_9HYPO|nr:hypothetical protein NW762_012702 [Fusarium torreyae]